MGDRLAQAIPVLGKIRLTLGMTFKLKCWVFDYSKKATDLKDVYWFTVDIPA